MYILLYCVVMALILALDVGICDMAKLSAVNLSSDQLFSRRGVLCSKMQCQCNLVRPSVLDRTRDIEPETRAL